MTETGEKIMALMGDGEWWTAEAVGKKLKVCRKKTRATMMGCVVAELAEVRRSKRGVVEFRRKD